MGATQSSDLSVQAQRSRPHNNQAAVAALLLHHHQLALQQTPSTSEGPARCPVPHGPRGAMARSLASDHEAQLNPLNKMPKLTQERAPEQKMELSRERTVSSIPRAKSSAAPEDSPYGAPQCPIPHDQRTRHEKEASCPVAHDKKSLDDGGINNDSETPGFWEYPSPQQFYNALVRKGWETPEEHVEMMVLIHNFLNERAWKEIIDWETLAGSDVSQLQLARFQGRPGTLSPRARMFLWLAWAFPNKFSSEPPFDRHDWIVRRGPTETHPEGEEIRYIIDYYSNEDEDAHSDENEASFNLDVRPAISNLSTIQMRWKKLLQEYESGELFEPFRSDSSSAQPSTSMPVPEQHRSASSP